MFSKKYLFETRSTRFKRNLFRGVIGVLFVMFSFSLVCIYIPIYGQKMSKEADEFFFKKSPDLIAVYTGDSGRINHSLEVLKEHPSSKLFISGVYAKNSLTTILKQRGIITSVDDYLSKEAHNIELDYLARNTIENVLATLNYLEDNRNLKHILIISSDYHIYRISKIVDTLKGNLEIDIHYKATKSDYTDLRNIKLLFKEFYKLIKASTFLMFWETN
jgi:uncharacterized SAM-binding protein YcdF (DUF218 family)